jgi:hypothetical protein
MAGQDYYYEVIQSINQTVSNLAVYYIFLFAVIVLYFFFLFHRTCNFRLLKLKKEGLYFHKWAFWILEAIYFPLMLNVIEFSTC